MKMNEQPLFSTDFGSRMWGMQREDSDYDVAAIYIVSTKTILSGAPYSVTKPQVKNTISGKQYEITSWEVGHLIHYLLKGNCNALWMTCSCVIYRTFEEHQILRNIVKSNLSRASKSSILGMSDSQISDATKRGLGIKGYRSAWRTLQFGINLLTYNKIVFEAAPMFVDEQMCRGKQEELINAYENSQLPDRPDSNQFYEWLLDARLKNLED
jgi:hypothetical protein